MNNLYCFSSVCKIMCKRVCTYNIHVCTYVPVKDPVGSVPCVCVSVCVCMWLDSKCVLVHLLYEILPVMAVKCSYHFIMFLGSEHIK